MFSDVFSLDPVFDDQLYTKNTYLLHEEIYGRVSFHAAPSSSTVNLGFTFADSSNTLAHESSQQHLLSYGPWVTGTPKVNTSIKNFYSFSSDKSKIKRTFSVKFTNLKNDEYYTFTLGPKTEVSFSIVD